jgi:diguanylate cyclase (GGDEF)-like protein
MDNLLTDFSFITRKTTIGQLPLSSAQFSETTPTRQVTMAFLEHSNLPGIIITDHQSRVKAVLSNRKFIEKMGGSPDTIERRLNCPIAVLINWINIEPLVLPSTCSIQDAVQFCLKRPKENIYEPVVVQFPDFSYKTLDMHTLLLAQNQLLTNAISIEKSRRKVAEALYRAGRAISGTLKLNTVLEVVLDFTTQFIEFSHVIFFIHKNDQLEVAASRGSYLQAYPVGKKINLSTHKHLEQILKSEDILITASLDEDHARELEVPPGASILGIPLAGSDENIGFLCLIHETSYFYEQNDITTVVNFVINSAVAINNALLYSKVSEDANHDPLTGLYNRRHFFETIPSLLEMCKTSLQPLSLMIIDIDHFKDINDRYGHLAGDDLLKSIADILNSRIRNLDFVCRYGGEEFLIVLPETPQHIALEIAERLRATVDNKRFNLFQLNTSAHTTISIGLSIYPQNAQSVETLIHTADLALYHAKISRNCVWLYSPDQTGEMPALPLARD